MDQQTCNYLSYNQKPRRLCGGGAIEERKPMGNTEVGGRRFDVNRVLSFLHNMMKNFPLLTAREILWSYFLPNDKAIEDARTQSGMPRTVNEIIESVINNYTDEDNISYSSSTTPDVIPGIYMLKMRRDRISEETQYSLRIINTLLVVANSHSHARSVSSYASSSYGPAPDYLSGKNKWRDSSITTCELVAKISDPNYRAGCVLFAGTTGK